MLGRHLPARARKLQQAVLVDSVFQTVRQRQLTQGLQPLQVGEYVFGLGRPWRLAEPGEDATLGACADRQ